MIHLEHEMIEVTPSNDPSPPSPKEPNGIRSRRLEVVPQASLQAFESFTFIPFRFPFGILSKPKGRVLQ